jgi:hypothetical protein
MSVLSQIVALGLALIAALSSSRLALRRFDDGRNIRVLESRYGCTHEEAERLYRLARQDGFASAYLAVFGNELRTPTQRDRAPSPERSVGEPRLP